MKPGDMVSVAHDAILWTTVGVFELDHAGCAAQGSVGICIGQIDSFAHVLWSVPNVVAWIGVVYLECVGE
jgi:hypothetical protein